MRRRVYLPVALFGAPPFSTTGVTFRASAAPLSAAHAQVDHQRAKIIQKLRQCEAAVTPPCVNANADTGDGDVDRTCCAASVAREQKPRIAAPPLLPAARALLLNLSATDGQQRQPPGAEFVLEPGEQEAELLEACSLVEELPSLVWSCIQIGKRLRAFHKPCSSASVHRAPILSDNGEGLADACIVEIVKHPTFTSLCAGALDAAPTAAVLIVASAVSTLQEELRDHSDAQGRLEVEFWEPTSHLLHRFTVPRHSETEPCEAEAAQGHRLRTLHLLRNTARLARALLRRDASSLTPNERVCALVALVTLLNDGPRTFAAENSHRNTSARVCLWIATASQLLQIANLVPRDDRGDADPDEHSQLSMHASWNKSRRLVARASKELTTLCLRDPRSVAQTVYLPSTKVLLPSAALLCSVAMSARRLLDNESDANVVLRISSLLQDDHHRGSPAGRGGRSDDRAVVAQQSKLVQLLLAIEFDTSIAYEVLQLAKDPARVTSVDPHPPYSFSETENAASKQRAPVDTAAAALHSVSGALHDLRVRVADAVLQVAVDLSSNGRLVPAPTAADRRNTGGGAPRLVPLVTAFLQSIQRLFLPLVRAHFIRSGGNDILVSAVHAHFLSVLAWESSMPTPTTNSTSSTLWYKRFIKNTSGDLRVGIALEMLYFTSLILLGRRNRTTASHDIRDTGDVPWLPVAQRLLQQAVTALVVNSHVLLQKSSADAAPALHDVTTFFSLHPFCFRLPNIRLMPVWQLHELVTCIHALCGSLASPTETTLRLLATAPRPTTAITTRSGGDDLRSSATASPNDGEAAQPDASSAGAASSQFASVPMWVQDGHRFLEETRTLLAERTHYLLRVGATVQQLASTRSSNKRRHTTRSIALIGGRPIVGSLRHFDEDRRGEGQRWLRAMAASEAAFGTALNGPASSSSIAENDRVHRLLAKRGIGRLLTLSDITHRIGLAFRTRDARRRRRGQNPDNAASLPGNAQEANVDPESASETLANDDEKGEIGAAGGSENRRCSFTLTRNVGEALGFSTDANGQLVSVVHGGPLYKALSNSGWFPDDVVGALVLRVGPVSVAGSTAKLREAMQRVARDSTVKVVLRFGDRPSGHAEDGTSAAVDGERGEDKKPRFVLFE